MKTEQNAKDYKNVQGYLQTMEGSEMYTCTD